MVANSHTSNHISKKRKSDAHSTAKEKGKGKRKGKGKGKGNEEEDEDEEEKEKGGSVVTGGGTRDDRKGEEFWEVSPFFVFLGLVGEGGGFGAEFFGGGKEGDALNGKGDDVFISSFFFLFLFPPLFLFPFCFLSTLLSRLSNNFPPFFITSPTILHTYSLFFHLSSSSSLTTPKYPSIPPLPTRITLAP